MNTYAVYFRPRGALATWPLASDTLFGAVCWAIRVLGLLDDKALTDWLEDQRLQPRFAFTHAFPAYLLKDKRVRFYPRPLIFQPTFGDFFDVTAELQWEKKCTKKAAQIEIVRIGKTFKKVAYVSEEVLSHIVAGDLKPIDGLRALAFPNKLYVETNRSLCTGQEAKILPTNLYVTEAVQHNQIDRMAGATVEGMLFYREETFFAQDAGLWAILKAEPTDVERYIRSALNYLADSGFGADRTAGKGHFDIWLEDFTLPFNPPEAQAMLTLSHYLPQEGEVNLQSEPLAYALKTLRPRREQKYPRPLAAGQASSPVYKQSVQVFEPGSVFALQTQKEIYGQLVRLTPTNEEPVYQSGAAVMVMM